MVSYLEFKSALLPEGCFSIHQVRTFFPLFDRNNLSRWIKKGLLIRLRREWYTFPELLQRPEFSHYIAGRFYRPSYISLFTALSIYGMIPEAVMSITSVTTLKTASCGLTTKTTNLNIKKRDFEHLLFDVHASEKILNFSEFIESAIL